MKQIFQLNDFLVEYNELLSKAALEYKGKIGALASPTLNKQEGVTLLYQDVIHCINNEPEKVNRPNPITIRLGFIVWLGITFLRLLKTSVKFRIESIPQNCIYVRTWLVQRSILNGKVKDDFFGKLIDDLFENQNVVVGFQPLGYGKTLDQFQNADKPDNFINPIGLLNNIDIIKLIFRYLVSAKIALKQDYIYKGLNIRSLINNSLKRDYFNMRSFQAYLELAIAEKIKKYNPKIFLYIFENQAWENAYLLTFNETEIKTIGYQSSGFSYRVLNFFTSKIDAENALSPDQILTVGNLYTKLLKKYGNYQIPIKTFAALRFNYKSKNGKYIVEESNPIIHNRILYAFAFRNYQYDTIISDLIDIFGNNNIEVHLKLHPLYNHHKLSKSLPDNFYFVNSIKIERFKNIYDVVLFNDNSFGIESLLMGVKSYEYDFGEFYPETRLFDFDLYPPVLNKNGLLKLRDDMLANTISKVLDKSYIQKYINYTYKAYTDQIDFI